MFQVGDKVFMRYEGKVGCIEAILPSSVGSPKYKIRVLSSDTQADTFHQIKTEDWATRLRPLSSLWRAQAAIKIILDPTDFETYEQLTPPREVFQHRKNMVMTGEIMLTSFLLKELLDIEAIEERPFTASERKIYDMAKESLLNELEFLAISHDELVDVKVKLLLKR